MATALDLVTAALQEIGVLAASETASSQEATDGLTRLNRYIQRLALQRMTIYTRTVSQFAIDANDGEYSVGPTGDIEIARPVHLDEVRYIDTSTSPQIEYPLGKLTEDGFAALPAKGLTASAPQAWYYNPVFPNGTLTLWPVPTASTLTGVLYAWTAVTEFEALSTAVSLPPGYEELLVTNLALLLCPVYGRQPNPATVKAATESLAAVKIANQREMDMSFDPAALGHAGGGGYSIYRN